MDKAPVKLLAGFTSIAGLILLLVVTFNLSQSPHSLTSQATGADINVALLTADNRFEDQETIVIDFSKEPCCKTLSHEYMQEGAVFDNEASLGWATYQANGFVNHLSVEDEVEPGAPNGITGTRMAFTEPVVKVGFLVQSGSPINKEEFRSARSLTIKAYDENNSLLFFKVTDTCLGQASSCKPSFIGVEANTKSIKYLETIINDPYSWSIDDLKFEI